MSVRPANYREQFAMTIVKDYFKQLTTFGGSERRFMINNGPERFAVFEARHA